MPCQDCSQLKNSNSVSVLTPAVVCSFSSPSALWIPLDNYVLRLSHGIPPQCFRNCCWGASKGGGVRQAQQSRLQVSQSSLIKTNAFSVCSDIRISCKMSFGGGKMKCSASKKRIENHISRCFSLGLVNIGIKHGPKSSFRFANRILGRTRNIWKCFTKTLVKPWMLSL